MISQEKELGLVRDILKESPRGLTVTGVAEKLHMSRNSSAKYLEMLLIAGQVDMRTFGRSKIFSLSRRMPLATVLSLSSEMIVFIDEGLKVVEANEQFIKFADTPREKVIGQSIENTSLPLLLHRDILLNIRDALRGQEFAREIGVSKGSVEYYFKVKIIPSVRDGRQIAAITFENITDRKRAELALKDSEARYRMLIENSPLGIFTCDMQGNMTSFNEKILELVDSKSPDFTRSVNLLNFEPLVQSGLTAGVYDRMVKGESVVSEGSYTSYWGKTVFLRLHLKPLRDSTGGISGVLGIVEDINERKRAEEALRESEEKFRKLADSANVGILLVQDEDIIYINQTLAALAGYTVEECRHLKYWDVMPQENKEYIRWAGNARQHGWVAPSRSELKIIGKDGREIWLDCSWADPVMGGMPAVIVICVDITERKRMDEELRSAKIQAVDIDICRTLLDIQSEYLVFPEKKIILNLDGNEKCFVRANELLHDVFANLINNAVKHTRQGTEIVVDLDIIEDNGKHFYRVAVEDNGPGVPDESKESIFNRMHMDSSRDMGLSLYIVRTLVNSYGGRVCARDRIEGDHTKGARFVVLLPTIK